ncbi:hypothetical protein WL766_05855 [Staphylococcus pasteuri]|uniref:Uncharacterized protein n=3 Tax=Staphylococcus TaxID=1279 RepID=A0ABY1H3Q5_9STAP|nr:MULTISPECIES: hypothetical protein [Staphylococcus]ODB68997.1 hypothetical protein A9N02_04635 [Staphylococcus sp. AOAB]RQX27172.1 hypothetical protein DB792_10010 [Staphylococcus warneri]ATH63286.1 hypothetical protein BJG87_09990 [Staphylococcus pasteuri]KKI56755.1 hypothetical protein UF70_0398 [Staphylococcus pasteuri]MBL3398404.1 hypothetical protein [Staphylococcus pasteuri]
MILYLLINIAVVLLIVGLDLYFHQFKQLRFSSILIAISLNAIIDLFIVSKYNFISIYTMILLIAWALLQLYLNKKIHPFIIKDQKFIAMIFAIVVSLSQFITNISSEQSLYMSLPYLAPAIFLIGAILLFVGTFESSELEYLPFLKSIKYPLTIGTIIIMIAFIAMMILTPFWYVFTIIYVLFMLFIIWQHIFK